MFVKENDKVLMVLSGDMPIKIHNEGYHGLRQAKLPPTILILFLTFWVPPKSFLNI